MNLVGYELITAAGDSKSLMGALQKGISFAKPASHYLHKMSVPNGLVCKIPQAADVASQNFLTSACEEILSKILIQASPQVLSDLRTKKIGVFSATTKGCLEDFIWKNPDIIHDDPFSNVLEKIVKLIPYKIEVSATVSNACASSLVALEYIAQLFSANVIEYAFLFGFDLIGPFIYSGFSALGIVSQTKNQPFSPDRDGLQLGDGVAGILLSKSNISTLQISFVKSRSSGGSMTRPDSLEASYKNLVVAAHRAIPFFSADAIISHGTGTIVNDAAEDLAMANVFGLQTPVLNTKWCIGHSLGASALIDIISAAEVLKNKTLFVNPTLNKKSNDFKMNYLNKTSLVDKKYENLKQIVVNSLGFGNVTALAVIQDMT